MKYPRIRVDFNRSDELDRIRISNDALLLSMQGLSWHEGMRVLLTDYEYEVEGELHLSTLKDEWVAVIDRNEFRSVEKGPIILKGIKPYPKVYADLESVNSDGHLRLIYPDTWIDIQRLHVIVDDGVLLTFTNRQGLEVDGYLYCCDNCGTWVAIIHWETLQSNEKTAV